MYRIRENNNDKKTTAAVFCNTVLPSPLLYRSRLHIYGICLLQSKKCVWECVCVWILYIFMYSSSKISMTTVGATCVRGMCKMAERKLWSWWGGGKPWSLSSSLRPALFSSDKILNNFNTRRHSFVYYKPVFFLKFPHLIFSLASNLYFLKK